MGAAEHPVSRRVEALRDLLPEGARLSDATFFGVRPESDGCLVLFKWRRDPRLYALGINLRDVSREYFYGTPVNSWEEWLQSFDVNLLVHLDTGLVENSARTQRDGFIELNDQLTWPYLPGVDYLAWDATGLGQAGNGIDLSVTALSVSADDLRTGAVAAVVTAYRSGARAPTVMSRVARSADDVATVQVVRSGSASTRMVVDTLHLACHEAASNGIRLIEASGNLPGAKALGFSASASQGGLVLETSFLDEDFGLPGVD
jgi:hypothetical protein